MDNENENSGQFPATDKQKQYIKDLTEGMTREQASRVIDVLKSNAANDYAQERANSEPTITDKQKQYIKDIYEQNGIEYDEEQVSGMTRREASELISSHTGEGAG